MKAQQFILHTDQYGFDMYFADPKKYKGIITDNKNEAIVITSEELANGAANRLLTGTGEWNFKAIPA
jgi:hypothetical protein